jgi:alkylhydroperoxidase family enzyme
MVGLRENEILNSRQSFSTDPKVDAALKFARTVVVNRGDVTDNDLRSVRNAGYSDGEIAEIVANVVLNVFTNYFNHVAQTEMDFPRVALKSRA